MKIAALIAVGMAGALAVGSVGMVMAIIFGRYVHL